MLAVEPISDMAGTTTATEGVSVRVNGEPQRVRARTLADLIVELGYADARVATARNGDFVPERARASTELRAGDSIEIVAPRQGG
jgi:sulfur carrier protein